MLDVEGLGDRDIRNSKSSALAELGRRGYRVVDSDDPGWREYREYVEPIHELHRGEFLWVEDRMTELLDSDDVRSLFVAGGVRNQAKFYDRFDAVVLLTAPADVILDRVARRTTNDYGKAPLERAEILADLASMSRSSGRTARTSWMPADRSTTSSPTSSRSHRARWRRPNAASLRVAASSMGAG